MKTILLFLSLLFAMPIIAQSGFRTEKGKIVWEHVYPENCVNIKSIIEGQDKMKILTSDDESYRGKASEIKSTIEANSVRLGSNADFEFTVTKIKDGYRVKVTGYTLLEKYGPLQMRVIPASLNKYYLDNGKIRNSEKTKTDLGYLDDFLTGLFSAHTPEAAVAIATHETHPSVFSGSK